MKSSRSSSSEWRCTRRRKPTMRTQAGRCMSWVELFDIIAVVMNSSRNSKNNSSSGGGGGSSCGCHCSGGGCCWCWCWCWHWCRFCLAATCCCCVWRRWRGAHNNQPVSLVMKPTSCLLRACRKLQKTNLLHRPWCQGSVFSCAAKESRRLALCTATCLNF